MTLKSYKSYLEELKMKTPLELLQDLRNDIFDGTLLFSDYKLNTIESTLKLYEARIKFLEETEKETEKKLNVLEIIKKKGINMLALATSDNVNKYNFMILPYPNVQPLSEKEYLLSREVLL